MEPAEVVAALEAPVDVDDFPAEEHPPVSYPADCFDRIVAVMLRGENGIADAVSQGEGIRDARLAQAVDGDRTVGDHCAAT